MNSRFSRQWERSPFTPQPALWVGCCNTLVPYPDCSPSVACFEKGALLLSCISQESREEGDLLASKQKFKRERSGAAALLFCYPAASMGCVSWRWLSSHSLPPAAAGVSPRELLCHSVKQKVASTFCHTPLVSAIASSHPQDCGCFKVKSVLRPPPLRSIAGEPCWCWAWLCVLGTALRVRREGHRVPYTGKRAALGWSYCQKLAKSKTLTLPVLKSSHYFVSAPDVGGRDT